MPLQPVAVDAAISHRIEQSCRPLFQLHTAATAAHCVEIVCSWHVAAHVPVVGFQMQRLLDAHESAVTNCALQIFTHEAFDTRPPVDNGVTHWHTDDAVQLVASLLFPQFSSHVSDPKFQLHVVSCVQLPCVVYFTEQRREHIEVAVRHTHSAFWLHSVCCKSSQCFTQRLFTLSHWHWAELSHAPCVLNATPQRCSQFLSMSTSQSASWLHSESTCVADCPG